MIEINYCLKYTIYFYIVLSVILYNTQSSFLFTETGDFKQFGTDDNKTILPFWLITQMLSILFYFIILIKTNDYI